MSDFETVPVGTTAELERVKRERDALAAYQEELFRELTACQSVLHNLAHDGQVTPEYANDAKAVLKRKPDASLLRLKLIAQAELMEQLAAGPAQAWDYIEMTDLANDLRQRAEKQTPSDCELECGAYGAYCKCKAEALQ